jgi:hypothetical protein
MKKRVAKDRYYEIYVDTEKNRMYTTFRGFWGKVSQVPNLLEDHIKAIKALSPGFTVLTDTINMKIPTKEINDFHPNILRIMDEKGLSKLALIPDRNKILKVSGERVMRDSGILDKVKFFDDIDEAEDWLDG